VHLVYFVLLIFHASYVFAALDLSRILGALHSPVGQSAGRKLNAKVKKCFTASFTVFETFLPGLVRTEQFYAAVEKVIHGSPCTYVEWVLVFVCIYFYNVRFL
jgi:hypothetical protein